MVIGNLEWGVFGGGALAIAESSSAIIESEVSNSSKDSLAITDLFAKKTQRESKPSPAQKVKRESPRESPGESPRVLSKTSQKRVSWSCEGFIRHRTPGPHPRIRLALPSSGVDLASIQHRFDIDSTSIS